MRLRSFVILLLLSTLAFADIVEDVRTALVQRNFAAADSQLQATGPNMASTQRTSKLFPGRRGRS